MVLFAPIGSLLTRVFEIRVFKCQEVKYPLAFLALSYNWLRDNVVFTVVFNVSLLVLPVLGPGHIVPGMSRNQGEEKIRVGVSR